MTVRVSPQWLALREPADAEARSAELVEHLQSAGGHVIHDLGAGTGAMGRWLAPRLSGPQHWVLHDRDADLLDIAVANVPAAVTAEARRSDITRLQPADLAGATLITASALLDMLTADELSRLVGACAAARCPVLLSLSVVGRVELVPADPLDVRVAAAFDAHQRRGDLLGPDAVARAAEELERLGAKVVTWPSPWRLGPKHADLAAEWFTGWLAAACEQEPELTAAIGDYAQRRLAQARAGQLGVTVHHADLLATAQSAPNREDSA